MIHVLFSGKNNGRVAKTIVIDGRGERVDTNVDLYKNKFIVTQALRFECNRILRLLNG